MSLDQLAPVGSWSAPPLSPWAEASVPGGDSLGARLEGHAAQFLEHATDLAVLGGMTVGMGTYRGLKHLGFARIFPRGKLNLVSQYSRRLGAAAVGFSGEVPAFLLTEKAIRQARGQAQDWSLTTLVAEGKSLGLSLMFLKGAHALRPGFVSSVAGLSLADQVDARRRGLTGRPLSDSLVDSTVFALQFTLSGRLIQGGMSPKLQRTWMRLEQQSREMERPKITQSLWGPQWALAGLGVGEGATTLGTVAFLKSSGPTSTGGNPEPTPFHQALAKKFGLPENNLFVERIVENVNETFVPDKKNYEALILNSEIFPGEWKAPLGDEFQASPERVLERATRQIQWATSIQAFQRVQSTYYEYLLQVAVEDAVVSQNGRALRAVLNLAGGQPAMAEVESLFRFVNLGEPYELPPTLNLKEMPIRSDWIREIDEWKFWTSTSMEAEKDLLKKYFSMVSRSGRVPERLGKDNLVFLRSGEAVTLTPHLA
ncbi:MAG: hypothetical protein R3257_07100, partial [bacterium]|nr:hypothetical protein [bacterium]